jgi:DNA-binding MarR family transcriptional regulator
VCVAFANSLRAVDLTSAQHELLANLLSAPEQGLTQRELAERLFVTKGNITGLVKRLEARGLVARQDDPDDRRKNNVTLTAQGVELAQASCDKQAELVSHIFGHFDVDDDEQLRGLMKTLRMGIKDYQALF